MPLSQNKETLTSWNPLGPSRPVTGLLYIYIYLLNFGFHSSAYLWTSAYKVIHYMRVFVNCSNNNNNNNNTKEVWFYDVDDDNSETNNT